MSTPNEWVAVVDDEQSVRKALERLIRSCGLTVRVFPSGADFLNSLGEARPSCVVLDLHMPPPDGFDVLEALRRDGIDLPVLVITADDSPQNRGRAMTNGAHTYLRKPIDEAMLLDAVRAAIAQ